MARFEDFTRDERHVLREAMAWAQSEFYDPGHTPEDRETLLALIREAKAAELNSGCANQPVNDMPPEPQETPAEAPQNEGDPDVGGAQETATATPRGPDRAGRMAAWWTNLDEGRAAAEKPTQHSAPGRPEDGRKYKGFLYIECGVCGHIHAFCAKQPIDTYRCPECGGKTALDDLAHMQIVCECGRNYRYMTNVRAQQMDVACFNCGAPVAVEWNDRFGRYITMGIRRGHKKGGRK